MREGILGGTFDPIHNAHLAVAQTCLDRLGLDRVLFVPARVPPHKSRRELTDGNVRLEMVKLAITGEPRFAVSDVELKREGPSYTVDTVRAEAERLGPGSEIVLIVGADQALELRTWHQAGELLELCRVVPVARPGFILARLDELKQGLPAVAVEEMKRAALDTRPMDVSSTDIRRLVREGKSISALVPPAVERFIRERGLYRD
jgi:nicotinate-nucleotide adenylyltransferase